MRKFTITYDLEENAVLLEKSENFTSLDAAYKRWIEVCAQDHGAFRCAFYAQHNESDGHTDFDLVLLATEAKE
jgi:hypothetical protein